MIAIACPLCGGDTLWRYFNIQRARLQVPDLPGRCYRGADPRALVGMRLCPEPSAHVQTFRQSMKEKIQ